MHPARHKQRLASDPIFIDFDQLRQHREKILLSQKARNTRVTYESCWRLFQSWCAAAGLAALPALPSSVRDFASWSLVEGYRLLTVQTRLAAIRHFHVAAGFASPCDLELREFLSCARRALKERPRGKAALTYQMLSEIAVRFPDSSLGARNRAMILLGFAAGWRRSEMLALQRCDVEIGPEGLQMVCRSSKTDQTGKGHLVGIPRGEKPLTCPVTALEAWLARRGDWEGALFPRFDARGQMTQDAPVPRSDILYRAVLRAVGQLDADPSAYGAHSLRAGMITEAAKNGATEAAIMQRTGHRNPATLQRYIRPATCFDFNPLQKVL